MADIFLSQGSVFHSRKEGAQTAFSYPTFYVYMNCKKEDQFKQMARKNFFGLLSFKASDYLHQKSTMLFDGAVSFLEEKCGYRPEDVWLYSVPRMFGYAFNPVSFWCCFQNSELEAILVEVHNTFGERHFYWIHPEGGIQSSAWYRSEKVFHVSPFFPVDGFYKFRFQISKQNIKIHINYYNPDESLRLATWVDGELSSFNDHGLFKLLLKYGWMTPLVVVRIHYQAFKLWLRKSRFYSKPSPPQQEITK